MLREHFDGDVAAEAGVAGTIDLAHAARAERRNDFVGTELGTGRKVHVGGYCTLLRRADAISNVVAGRLSLSGQRSSAINTAFFL
jgi:hypothetical protein